MKYAKHDKHQNHKNKQSAVLKQQNITHHSQQTVRNKQAKQRQYSCAIIK
jgi:hypothetical protein